MNWEDNPDRIAPGADTRELRAAQREVLPLWREVQQECLEAVRLQMREQKRRERDRDGR